MCLIIWEESHPHRVFLVESIVTLKFSSRWSSHRIMSATHLFMCPKPWVFSSYLVVWASPVAMCPWGVLHYSYLPHGVRKVARSRFSFRSGIPCVWGGLRAIWGHGHALQEWCLRWVRLFEEGLVCFLDSLLIRLSSSVSESGSLIWVLGSSLRVLSFLSVALGLAFSPGFLPLILSRLGLCAG